MLKYLIKRSLYMIITLVVVSLVAFIIIQLPPGDYATSLISSLSASGTTVSQEMLENLRIQYGLNEPPIVQYAKWMWGIFTRGDFGLSFSFNQPVSGMIWDRVWLTAGISLLCVLITWMIAFPIGIFSAVRQYSLADYIFTFIGFIGVSVPSFLVALIVMYVAFKVYGMTITGLFSSQYLEAPWSLARLGDLISHLWIPVLILALEAARRRPSTSTMVCEGIILRDVDGLAVQLKQEACALLEQGPLNAAALAGVIGASRARVLAALGMQNALNLDSGGSTALWYGGYKAGPGRNIPNAIVLVGK